jgi:hypothetical protein
MNSYIVFRKRLVSRRLNNWYSTIDHLQSIRPLQTRDNTALKEVQVCNLRKLYFKAKYSLQRSHKYRRPSNKPSHYVLLDKFPLLISQSLVHNLKLITEVRMHQGFGGYHILPHELCQNNFNEKIFSYCGIVVRVLGYRSGGPGSIPGTTMKKK